MLRHKTWKYYQSISRVHSKLEPSGVSASARLMLMFNYFTPWPPPIVAALSFAQVPVSLGSNGGQVRQGKSKTNLGP